MGRVVAGVDRVAAVGVGRRDPVEVGRWRVDSRDPAAGVAGN